MEGERPTRAPVLVTGASGFLGRAIVRAFASSGRAVRGMVRDPAKAATVRSAGGTPVVADVRDPAGVLRATRGCGSIVHVAAHTSAPDASDETLREVRVRGTQNLLAAARAHRIARLVVGSGYWVYADQRQEITEESAVDPEGESRTNFDAEEAGRRGRETGALEVVFVRPGMVYGDGSWFRGVAEAILEGSYAVVDGGRNHWSFVALADAAAGFRTVESLGTDGEVYDLVDGRPAPWGEFARFVADELRASPPASVPMVVAVERWGTGIAHHLAANRAATGARLRRLGWRPNFPSFRDGVPPLLREMGLPSTR